VSVFDLLPEHAAVIMESVARPTLLKVLQRSHRLKHPFRPPKLEGTFRNVGAWLRCFHGLPTVEELKERMAGREEFVSSIRESCQVLMKARIARRFLRDVLSLVEAGASDLPERFPLVLGHVDYGPHNIFVSPGGQVTVIDTLANRRVPMYKDLAYFLFLVKAMPIRSYSLGTLISGETVASWERAFLSGYFGGAAVPLQAIRLFEIEASLRKWAERASTLRHSTGLKMLAKRLRMLVRNMFYRRHVEALLADVGHQESAANGAPAIQRPAPPPAAIKVHVVRPAEIETGHVDLWRRLQQGAPWLDSPFLSPEYALAVGAARGDVEVAVLEREGETVGFLPFQRGRRNVGRPVGLRLSDLSGAVVRADVTWNPQEVIRACGLTSWHFTSTPAAQEALQPYQLRTIESPYVALAGGFHAYLEGRRRAGSELIQQARRKRRKFERERGPLRFEWRTFDQAAFNTLLRLKAEQRRRTNTVDALQSRWAIELLDSIRHSRSDEFAGVLSCLYREDRVVAVHLGMRTRSVFHWWFPAFSPEFGDYSPGLILMLDLIQHCADSGMSRMDLGRGHERYKMSLMTDNQTIADGCVAARLIDRLIQSALFGVRALARSGPFRGPVKHSRSVFRRFLT
jgi:CelD/BcsL family acetyltransferase involved in cellulose biosynthesis